MSKTYEGYLLIADITGYTQYLTESELEHAQETLTALLQLLIEHTNPPLVISRLEGDAVISYGLRENFFNGQSFIEKVENTYVTFRKALDRLVLNNTCQCNACANIRNLDLKFFVHYGSFGIQRISSYDELIGNDINLIHRLVKNHVSEVTGFRAYALYTDEAIRQLGVEGLESSMTEHSESYDQLGKVKVWVQDLVPVWEHKKSTVEVTLPEEHVALEFEVLIDIPQEQVWEYMTQPEFRYMLTGSDTMKVTNRASGRIAPGSVYQCYHGDKIIPQTILEWQPFERMIVKELSPMFPGIGGVNEYKLNPMDGKTKLIKRMSKLTGPLLGRILLTIMMPALKRMMPKMFMEFKRKIESDYRVRNQSDLVRQTIPSDEIQQAAIDSLHASQSKG